MLPGAKVHRGQRGHQRGDRLQETGDAHVFAVRDSAFQAACVVRRPVQPLGPGRIGRRPDRVVHLRAGKCRSGHAVANLHGLHGRHGHQGVRQPGIEPAVPLDVAAQPRRHAVRHDLERAAQRVARRLGLVDGRHHPLCQRRILAADALVVGDGGDGVERQRLASIGAGAADRRHVGGDPDAESLEQGPGARAGRHARRRLARAGALQDVPADRSART